MMNGLKANAGGLKTTASTGDWNEEENLQKQASEREEAKARTTEVFFVWSKDSNELPIRTKEQGFRIRNALAFLHKEVKQTMGH